MEKSYQKLDIPKNPNKNKAKIIPHITFALSLITTQQGCAIEEKGPTKLDPKKIEFETAKAQDKEIEQINNDILKLLQNEKTQKEGIQLININPHKINERTVRALIKINEEERIKKPGDRKIIFLTALGNLTIERKIADDDIEKIEEFMQIKNDIITYLADILEEEHKEEKVSKSENSKEIHEREIYKNEIKKIIHRVFSRISTNPEFIKNDFENLKKLSKYFDPELKAWAEEKKEKYNIYKSTILKGL